MSVVLNSGVMPAMWNVQKAFVHPDWHWFWDNPPNGALFWQGGGTVIHPLLGSPALTNVNGEWAFTPNGLGADNNSNGDEIDIASPYWILPTATGSNTSFFCCIDVDSYNGSNSGFWRSRDDAKGENFFIANGTNGLWIRASNVTVFQTFDPGSMTTGLSTFGFSFEGATRATGWINGDRVANTTHTRNWSSVSSNEEIRQLGWQSSTSERIDGRWLCAYFWDDYWLEDWQHRQLNDDFAGPFRMWLPEDESVFVAAAGAFTLTADAGSYTKTGTAANLEGHRVVDAAAGSYTLSGTAANLEGHRIIGAAAGSYTVTGTAADLLLGFVFSADAGSYTVTGTAATLLHDGVIAATAGAYTVSGTVALLEYHRIMAADAGSYTITGTAAGLFFGFTIAADAGSYAVSGTAAGLLATRIIAAAAGSYTLTGTAVDFVATAAPVTATRSLIADSVVSVNDIADTIASPTDISDQTT